MSSRTRSSDEPDEDTKRIRNLHGALQDDGVALSEARAELDAKERFTPNKEEIERLEEIIRTASARLAVLRPQLAMFKGHDGAKLSQSRWMKLKAAVYFLPERMRETREDIVRLVRERMPADEKEALRQIAMKRVQHKLRLDELKPGPRWTDEERAEAERQGAVEKAAMDDYDRQTDALQAPYLAAALE